MNTSYELQQKDNIKRLAHNFTQKDLDNVMNQNLNLTSSGIMYPDNPLYNQLRIDLSGSLNQFQLACAFLSLCKRTKSPNYKVSNSYGLKHKLERFLDMYISNGAICAAAMCLGIPYAIVKANISLAISKILPTTTEIQGG